MRCSAPWEVWTQKDWYDPTNVLNSLKSVRHNGTDMTGIRSVWYSKCPRSSSLHHLKMMFLKCYWILDTVACAQDVRSEKSQNLSVCARYQMKKVWLWKHLSQGWGRDNGFLVCSLMGWLTIWCCCAPGSQEAWCAFMAKSWSNTQETEWMK